MVQSCCGILSLSTGVKVIGLLNISLGLLGVLYPSGLPYRLPMIVCSATPESTSPVEMWYSSSVVSTFDTSEYVLHGLCIGFGAVAIGATYVRPGRLWSITWLILFIVSYAIVRIVWNLYLAFSTLGIDTIVAYWGHPTDSSALYTAGICVNINQRFALVESTVLLLIYLYCFRVLTSYIDTLDYATDTQATTTEPPVIGRALSFEEANALDLEQLRQSGALYQGESLS